MLIGLAFIVGSALVGGITSGIASATRGENFWTGFSGGATTGIFTGIGMAITAISGGSAAFALGVSGGVGSGVGNYVQQVVGGMLDEGKSFKESMSSVNSTETLINTGLGALSGTVIGVIGGGPTLNMVEEEIQALNTGFINGYYGQEALGQMQKDVWTGFYGQLAIENAAYAYVNANGGNVLNDTINGSSNSQTTTTTPAVVPTPTPKSTPYSKPTSGSGTTSSSFSDPAYLSTHWSAGGGAGSSRVRVAK